MMSKMKKSAGRKKGASRNKRVRTETKGADKETCRIKVCRQIMMNT